MKQEQAIRQLCRLAEEWGCGVKPQEPMKHHVTMRVGGPADLLLEVPTEQALRKVLLFCREEEVPYYVVGRGSNLLVSDRGVQGVVLLLTGDMRKIRREGNEIVCGAGASLASVCSFAREHGLSGLEFAWGIPGSAGGAAYMNAGAYKGEMHDVLIAVRYMTPDGQIGEYHGEELQLSYRHSVFTDTQYVILALRLSLHPGDPTQIGARMDHLMKLRCEKQPYDLPSSGSTFKRPEGYFAAALIEQCGLKGLRVGGAQVSPKHSGFVVNDENGTCDDVLSVIRLVQEKVKEQTGVQLECEVRLLGR